MPDTSCVTYAETGPDGRGWSPFSVSLIAILVLLLGVGGAIFGIYAGSKVGQPSANPGATLPQGFPSATGGPGPDASSPPPSPSSPTTSASSPGGFPVPNVAGLDFREARTKLRDLRLGVSLVFTGTNAGDMTVANTQPAAGATVRRGVTIKVFVKGEAPPATVPGIMGVPCSQAAGIIVDHGLFPDYESGRNGVVVQQSPVAGEPHDLKWNDQMKIWCSTATASPSP
jgi:PASTA domain